MNSLLTVPMFIVLIMGMLFSGCARTPVGNFAEIQMSADGTVKTDIIVKNKAMQKKLAIESCNARMISNLVQAAAVVQNNTKDKVSIAYRFEWFDSNSMPVDSALGRWRDEWIEAGEIKTLTGMGGSLKATSARFSLRWMK